MSNAARTRDELQCELEALRAHVAELERANVERRRAAEARAQSVTIRQDRAWQTVRSDASNAIHSDASNKPAVPDEVLAKWQQIVDVMAMIVGVPAGLIMKVHPSEIEVFVASATEGNPYEKGEKADLNTGLYCETVMKNRALLLARTPGRTRNGRRTLT